MRHDRDTALDQCLAWVRAGRDVEGCLELYPEYADELRPLLRLARDIGRVPIPPVPAVSRAAGQRRMLAAHARRSERAAQLHPVLRHAGLLRWALVPGRPGSLRPAWPAVVAVLFLLLLGTSGVTVASSAGSLPGDALYPVKVASQRLQLALTLNPVARGLLIDRYDAQQRQDVQAVLKAGRRATVEFQGTLQSIEESLWIVSGLPVAVSETTAIVGSPYLGAVVRVRARLPGDGRLMATWVSVESGVGPLPMPTAEATRTLPPTSTPPRAETALPTGTVEPTPPAEETGAPTSDDTQTQTEIPGIVTPEPTASPETEDRPAPTETTELRDTQDDEDIPGPTEEQEPDDTPEPAGTRDPDDTPEPSDATRPGEGAEPTETPGEDDEPHEEETPADEDEPEDGKAPPDEDEPEEEETPEPGATPDD